MVVQQSLAGPATRRQCCLGLEILREVIKPLKAFLFEPHQMASHLASSELFGCPPRVGQHLTGGTSAPIPVTLGLEVPGESPVLIENHQLQFFHTHVRV